MKKLATRSDVLGNLTRWAALLVAILFVAGCVAYTAPVKPPLGGIYTSVKAPLTSDFNGNPTGQGITKVSKEETRFIWDFLLTGSTFAWDDVGIANIAREGGIKEVSYADYELMSVLGIYAQFTVNLYGE